MDVIVLVVVSEYRATAGLLHPPDSPHPKHQNLAHIASSLAKTNEPAAEVKAQETTLLRSL